MEGQRPEDRSRQRDEPYDQASITSPAGELAGLICPRGGPASLPAIAQGPDIARTIPAQHAG